MNLAKWLLSGAAGAAIILSLALAVHYRNRAEHYREEMETAQGALRDLVESQPVRKTDPLPDLPAMRYPASASSPVVPVQTDDTPLRQQIVIMEQQLAEKDAAIMALRRSATNRPVGEGGLPRRGFFQPDTLRTTNPELYEDIQNRRREAQQAAQTELAIRTDYLLNQDTAGMTTEEKQQYEEIVRLLTDTWQLTRMIQTDLAPDQRREVVIALRDNMRELQPLLAAERTREFYAMGRELGYTPPQATNFASTVNQIIQMTTVRNLVPGYGRGSWGGSWTGAVSNAVSR